MFFNSVFSMTSRLKELRTCAKYALAVSERVKKMGKRTRSAARKCIGFGDQNLMSGINIGF
jgi:hypothetical protein